MEEDILTSNFPLTITLTPDFTPDVFISHLLRDYAYVWDGNGFWLMTKRLVAGTFSWPESEEEAREIGVRDVKGLLEGKDVFRRLPVFGDIMI